MLLQRSNVGQDSRAKAGYCSISKNLIKYKEMVNEVMRRPRVMPLLSAFVDEMETFCRVSSPHNSPLMRLALLWS